jgi:hypothetical protein
MKRVGEGVTKASDGLLVGSCQIVCACKALL